MDSDQEVKLLSSEIEMVSAVDSEEDSLVSLEREELALSAVEKADSVETEEDALWTGEEAQPPRVKHNNKNKGRCFFFIATFYRIQLRQWIVFSWQDYMLMYLNDMIGEERQ